jgi:ABC-type sulfate transport system permease subunit
MFHLLPFLSPLFQQDDEIFGLFGGSCVVLLAFAFSIILIIAQWKIFSKAGKPGWAAIIPIYNLWVLLEIVDRPGWWILLMLIPGVNLVIGIIITLDLAKAFGKGTGFAIGLILLPFIFMLILGFGDAQYQGSTPAYY